MRRLSILLAVVVLGAASGCGSSSHRYTVSQVKTAFATQGISLRKTTGQEIPGFVLLRHLSVGVLVEVSATKAAHGSEQYLDAPPGYRTQTKGNVTVAFKASSSQAVKTALTRLH